MSILAAAPHLPVIVRADDAEYVSDIRHYLYFRHVARVRRGEASRESLLAEQERYDTHFVTSSVW
jgi:hypothetical protein